MDSNRPPVLQIFCLLFLLGWPFFSEKCFAGPGNNTFDPANAVSKIYQRILAIGRHVLENDERIIIRLTKKRPVDYERVIARYRSARNQIVKLRRSANFLEKQILSSDPKLAKIHSQKARIPYINEAHKKNLAKLNELSGNRLAETGKLIESACETIDETGTVASFPVRTIDEAF
ncbi:MAG: hypothetical protein HQM08_26305 [Candidatus Riflebacteria bacterium]|nr:hypothetical protein [Candidatus Riflebacteria bacterium]